MNHANVTARGDELIRRLHDTTGDGERVGELSYDLMKLIFSGYSPKRLQTLLESDRHYLVDAAAWVISELGPGASEMIPSIAFLLRHSSPRARFWAVDAVHAAAGPRDGDVIAQAICLIDDPEKDVRWEVMYFLSRALRSQLIESIRYLGGQSLRGSIEWLSALRGDVKEVGEVIAKFSDEDIVTQRIAVAAAVRILPSGKNALEVAVKLPNEEIRRFAKEELDNLAGE